MSGVPPYLLKTADNPEGVDGAVFEGIQKAVTADRYVFFTDFFKNFYNTSAYASLACVPTWHEDFRKDLAKIDVPTLVIHGDSDRIVPFSSAGQRTAKLVKGAELVVIKDGPHNVAWTHAEEVNAALLKFLQKGSVKTTPGEQQAVA